MSHKTAAQIELDRIMWGTTLEDKKAIKESLKDRNVLVVHKADGKTYEVLSWSQCRCLVNDMDIKIETGWFPVEQFVLAPKNIQPFMLYVK